MRTAHFPSSGGGVCPTPLDADPLPTDAEPHWQTPLDTDPLPTHAEPHWQTPLDTDPSRQTSLDADHLKVAEFPKLALILGILLSLLV